jgi:hypothetical protein
MRIALHELIDNAGIFDYTSLIKFPLVIPFDELSDTCSQPILGVVDPDFLYPNIFTFLKSSWSLSDA